MEMIPNMSDWNLFYRVGWRCYFSILFKIEMRIQIIRDTFEWPVRPIENYVCFRNWKSRITFSLYSLSNLEPVLNVRRALLGLGLELTPEKDVTKPLRDKLRSELSECWLLSAKVARKAGQVFMKWSQTRFPILIYDVSSPRIHNSFPEIK